MRKTLAVLLAVSILSGPAAGANPLTYATAEAREYYADQGFSQQELDNLLAPVALYPDPLLAQILVAATFADQIEDAARWMRRYNDPYGIDEAPWDVSVKAVAHYPPVLYMMAERIDWTVALGQAYVYQSGDVMASVQHLRRMAHSAGHLASGPYQQVVVEREYIEIFPFQPEYIYVPAYDPAVVFVEHAYFHPVVAFGPPLLIGAWLNRDCDWRGRRIYYHGWRRGRHWIDRSRPHMRVTNVYVDNSFTIIRFNREVVRRSVNYDNLNRYARVHREVNYRDRGDRGGRGDPNDRDRIVRREADNPGPDALRGHPAAEREATREEKQPRSRENQSLRTREEKPPAVEADRAPRTREAAPAVERSRPLQRIPSPEVARQALQPRPREVRQPPREAFRDNRRSDPDERRQTIRARAQQPGPPPVANVPKPQRERSERAEQPRGEDKGRERDRGRRETGIGKRRDRDRTKAVFA